MIKENYYLDAKAQRALIYKKLKFLNLNSKIFFMKKICFYIKA